MTGRFLFRAAVCLAVCFAVQASFAQDRDGGRRFGRRGGGPPGMRMGMSMGGSQMLGFLTNEQVSKELGLDKDQQGYLSLLQEETDEEDKKFRESMEDVSREERFEKFREHMEEQSKKIDESIEEIIGEDKMARLKQIQLQGAGAMALMSPQISEKLGITEDQQSQMRDAIRDTFMELRSEGGGQGGPGGPGRGFDPEMMQKMREAAEPKVMAVLTDKQKEEWKNMVGEPANIDFDKIRQEQMERARARFGGDGQRDRDGDRGRRRRPDSNDSET